MYTERFYTIQEKAHWRRWPMQIEKAQFICIQGLATCGLKLQSFDQFDGFFLAAW